MDSDTFPRSARLPLPRSRSLAAAAIAVVTALSGLVLAATTAGAAPPPADLTLTTTTITVQTSNHQQWNLGLWSALNGIGGSTAFSLSLSRPVPGGTEAHQWNVPLGSSRLTFNGRTQRGTLKTPASTAPLTTVDMTFVASSHRALRCYKGSETLYKGNLAGRATLITHLTGGGTVGGQHVAFKSGTTTLTADRGCFNPLPTGHVCTNYESFFDSAPHGVGVLGFSSSATRYAEVSRNVSMTKPRASRTDSVTTKPSRAPSFSRAAKTLHVPASSGMITGSGKIVANALKSSSSSCKLKGVKHTQVQYFPSSSTRFVNTAGHPLVGHTSLTGRIIVRNNASGYFAVDRWH